MLMRQANLAKRRANTVSDYIWANHLRALNWQRTVSELRRRLRWLPVDGAYSKETEGITSW